MALGLTEGVPVTVWDGVGVPEAEALALGVGVALREAEGEGEREAVADGEGVVVALAVRGSVADPDEVGVGVCDGVAVGVALMVPETEGVVDGVARPSLVRPPWGALQGRGWKTNMGWTAGGGGGGGGREAMANFWSVQTNQGSTQAIGKCQLAVAYNEEAIRFHISR